MNRSLLLCVLFALGSSSASRAWAAADPGDQFLDAYFLIQDGDNAEHQNDWANASAKYTAALEILRAVKSNSPDWNPHVIDFRIKHCTDHLEALKSKLAPSDPSPAPTEVAAPPVPPVESESVQQLRTELQQARDDIHQLQQTRDDLATKLETKLKESPPADHAEAQQTLEQLRALQSLHEAVKAKLDEVVAKAATADELTAHLQQSQEKVRALEAERTDLNTKLQAALASTAPTQTNPQIEDLMKQNADLTAKLATAQADIANLQGQAGASAETERIQLRAELTDTKQQIEKLQTENFELKHSRDEFMVKLTESERQLRAVKVSNEKSDQIIQELRKDNTRLREIVDRNGLPAGKERQRKKTNAAAKTPPAPEPESGTNKLVATIKSPATAGNTEPTSKVVAKPAPGSKSTEAPLSAASPEVRALLNEGRAAFALKDYNTAAAKYEAALIREPDNVTALSNIGMVRFQQDKLDEAEVALRKVVVQSPNDSQSRALLGVIYFRKGRTEDAFGELTRAIALDPRNAEAHNYLGITLSEKGWQTAAEQEIRRALDLNPQYADAHFNLAVMYIRQKTPNLDLARYHYQKALDLGAEPDKQLEAALKPVEPKPSP